MKKIIISLTVMFCLISSIDISAHAHETDVKDAIADYKIGVGSDTNAYSMPAWRWWESIGPLSYQGRTKYFRITKTWNNKSSTCYDGYLGARNIGGGNFIYEGYLYICGQPRPIPTKVEVEEL